MARRSLPWREWHEKDSKPENECGHELQSDGDAPRSLALSRSSPTDIVGTIIDPEGDHDPERNSKLLECNKAPTDLRRGEFSTEN